MSSFDITGLVGESFMSRIHVGIASCALAALVTACGGSGEKPAAAPAESAAPTPAASAPAPLPGNSTVTGRIKYTGTAEKPRVIRMGSDPVCGREGQGVTSEVLVVGPDNELQNVFVYVKDGLGNRTFAPPAAPVVLDQKGCRYMPHVFGVQVGQPVEIVNSDPTLHNVHAVSKTNAEFNFAQPAPMKNVRTFDKPEIMVPFKCEVHGWMNSYAGVVPHPFYAVSKPDGSFEIKGLPAGTYTIEAWHEQLGMQTQQVTVDGNAGATADFSFAAKT
jgi:plastocyanin